MLIMNYFKAVVVFRQKLNHVKMQKKVQKCIAQEGQLNCTSSIFAKIIIQKFFHSSSYFGVNCLFLNRCSKNILAFEKLHLYL